MTSFAPAMEMPPTVGPGEVGTISATDASVWPKVLRRMTNPSHSRSFEIRQRQLSPTHSAERKRVGLDAGVEEADFERMIHDRTGIANELIEPLRRDDPLPV